MPMHMIEFSCRLEPEDDGSVSVLIAVTGLPGPLAQKVGEALGLPIRETVCRTLGADIADVRNLQKPAN